MTARNYPYDLATVRRTVALILPPGGIVEVRALDARTAGGGKPHVCAGYFDSPDAVAAALPDIRAARGIYITLNAPDPALFARSANRFTDWPKNTTTDPEVQRRHWLLVDCDPVRPSGISATDAEHQLGLARARQIRAALAAEGWPEPVYADSGNGGHLLYRLDLPAADDGLVRGALAGLAARFGDGLVSVDHSVYNPSRIGKLYGTWAGKGDDTPDRPHRRATLLAVPELLTAVAPSLLAALAPAPEPARRATYARAAGPDFDLDAWVHAYLPEAGAPRDCQTQAGRGRKWVFNCPWNATHTDRSAWLLELGNGAISAGCQHNGCQGRDWRELRALKERSRPALRLVAPPPTVWAPPDEAPPPAAGDTLAAADDPAAAAADDEGPGDPADGDPADGATAALALRDRVLAASDRAAVEELLPELVEPCATLSRTGLLRVIRALEKRGISQERSRAWRSAINAARAAARGCPVTTASAAEEPAAAPPADPQQLADFAVWVREQLNSRRGGTREVRELVANTLADYLAARGQLLHELLNNDGDRAAYLLTDDQRTLSLEERGDNLPVLAALAAAGLNAAEPAYAWVLGRLRAVAYNAGRPVRLHRYSCMDAAAQVLYVSCGTTGYVVAQPGAPLVWRPNGTAGILFHADAVFPTWDYTAEPRDFRLLTGLRPPLGALPATPEYDAACQTDLLHIFLLGVLSGQRPLPLAAFIGARNSGKSTTGRTLLKLLFGPDKELGGLPDDARSFMARAVSSLVLTIDNFDTEPESWLLDALAACVTGVASAQRVLYTNHKVVEVKTQAALLVTTRTVPISRPDIIERILPFFISDLDDSTRAAEADIFGQVNAWRDGGLVFAVQLAANMLAHRAAAPAGLPGRFVDFGHLAYSYYAATGRPAQTALALAAWRRAYMLAVGEPDELLHAVVEHLPAGGIYRQPITEVIRQLDAEARGKGEDTLPHLGGAKTASARLHELGKTLVYWGIKVREDVDASKGRTLYTLTRLAED